MDGDDSVRYRSFVRAVAQFAPSLLLPRVAAEACAQVARWGSTRSVLDGNSSVTPWALAEIARESIVHGVDFGTVSFGGRTPTPRDLHRLCGLYGNLDDPICTSEAEPIEPFLVRLAFEQFRWQLSEFEELGRPHALLVETAAGVDAPAHAEAAWRAAIGCSVDELLAIGFFLFVWAAKHQGWIDLSWMAGPQFGPVLERYPRDLIHHVAEDLLGATRAQIRGLEPTPGRMPENVREHRFNPLTAKPLVRMGNGRLLAPHPLLILHRLSVNGLYYDRCREPDFTRQLGAVFEAYVGRHLRLIRGATVLSELPLRQGGKSVDWIVVLPDVVLLVEVKATSLTEGARAGLDALATDRARTIDHACTQLERTAALVRVGDPALQSVPSDRPMRGLIVTREPYWHTISGFSAPLATTFPTTVASAREVEHLGAVGLHRDVGSALLSLDGVHSNSALNRVLQPYAQQFRNPILETAWADGVGWKAA